MPPDWRPRHALHSTLDRLAQAGERHMKNCGVPADRRTRAAALGLFDKQLNLHDRLLTADEFMARRDASGFVEAALQDAERFINAAERTELDRIALEQVESNNRMRWGMAAGVAVLVLAIVLWLLLQSMPSVRDSNAVTPTLALTPAARGVAPDDKALKSRPDERSERTATDRAISQRSSGRPLAATSDRAKLANPPQGLSRGERSAAEKPSKASAGSSGAPSDKASPNDGKSDEQQVAQQSARSAPSDNPGSQSERMSGQQRESSNMSGFEAEAESGAAAKQAAGSRAETRTASAGSQQSGSNENREQRKGAGNSPGRQQSAQSANEQGAQGQSANPGASNNASQGKGQGAGKDALKKSRGVASMILGVPIPDRIRGLPNPGLVRTVQKKTVPKEDPAASVDAQDRGERTNALGSIEHQQLLPWQKDLVRDYFSQDSSKKGQQ